MATSQPLTQAALARQVRERFVGDVVSGVAALADAIQELLTSLLNQVTTARETQQRRDLWTLFQQRRGVWTEAATQAWKDAAQRPVNSALKVRPATLSLELEGDDVVENKIVASRMALPVMERVSVGFDDLRLRIQQLEDGSELASSDILRPEVVVQILVEQWVHAGLDRTALHAVSDVIQGGLATQLLAQTQSVTKQLNMEIREAGECGERRRVRRARSEVIRDPG